jgi:hypothetical protein
MMGGDTRLTAHGVRLTVLGNGIRYRVLGIRNMEKEERLKV